MGLAVKPLCIEWSDLGTKLDNKFEIVFCRGSSLVYAGTWHGKAALNYDVLRAAIVGFYDCLDDNGILYLDTTSSEGLETPGYRVIEHLERDIRGQMVRMTESIYTNKENLTREWSVKIWIGQDAYEVVRQSYYIPHIDLMEMLKQEGFQAVKKVQIFGEHYDVFECRKRADY